MRALYAHAGSLLRRVRPEALQGRAVSEVANTLDAVRVLVRRYVVMSDEQAIAQANVDLP